MSRGAKWRDDERVKRLKAYCEQGMSASEIAAAFGDTTRCAVTGQAWRRGFELHGNPQVLKPHVPKEFKAVKPKKKPRPVVEEVAEDEPPPKKKRIRPRYDIVRTKAEYQQMLAEAVRNTKKLQDAD